jgi:hypothetical protein
MSCYVCATARTLEEQITDRLQSSENKGKTMGVVPLSLRIWRIW